MNSTMMNVSLVQRMLRINWVNYNFAETLGELSKNFEPPDL